MLRCERTFVTRYQTPEQYLDFTWGEALGDIWVMDVASS